MHLLGHIGITGAAVDAFDPKADLKLPMFFAILPDLLDKPVVVLFPSLVNWNSRCYAHTLLASAVVLAALLALRPTVREALLLWACYSGHLLLDRMWLLDGRAILFWPFSGPFPAWSPDRPGTPHLLAYNIAGELVGAFCLLKLLRLRRRATVLTVRR